MAGTHIRPSGQFYMLRKNTKNLLRKNLNSLSFIRKKQNEKIFKNKKTTAMGRCSMNVNFRHDILLLFFTSRQIWRFGVLEVISVFMWIMVVATFLVEMCPKLTHRPHHGCNSRPEHVFACLEGRRAAETHQNTYSAITRNSLKDCISASTWPYAHKFYR